MNKRILMYQTSATSNKPNQHAQVQNVHYYTRCEPMRADLVRGNVIVCLHIRLSLDITMA